MIDSISRRAFLRRSGAGVTAFAASGALPLSAAGAMPLRTLGRTGLKVSLLAFGGGSQFLLAKDGLWEAMLERAIAAGVNLFDTSSGYQWKASKTSEERFGEILPRHRKSIYVSTKLEARDYDKARKEFERSLQRMKMDYVDLLMIHSIEPSEDLAALEKGAYRAIAESKEQKLARFIGFSSMNSAAKSKELIENLEVDAAILAMNATQYGDFAKVALPAARAKNVGIVAMKLMRGIVGNNAPASDLLYYAWTQPGVASAVVGHVGMDPMEENLRIALSYSPQRADAFDRRRLEARLSSLAGPHALCWARPEYRDSAFA